MSIKSIDVYDNYYDFDDSEFPKLVTWTSPEDGEGRSRIIRNERESEEFFSWFNRKYPEVTVTIK